MEPANKSTENGYALENKKGGRSEMRGKRQTLPSHIYTQTRKRLDISGIFGCFPSILLGFHTRIVAEAVW